MVKMLLSSLEETFYYLTGEIKSIENQVKLKKKKKRKIFLSILIQKLFEKLSSYSRGDSGWT